MPIGPITPGDPVDVSPDTGGNLYPSVQAPSATMPVTAEDLQALTLVVMNIQEKLANRAYFGQHAEQRYDSGAIVGTDIAWTTGAFADCATTQAAKTIVDLPDDVEVGDLVYIDVSCQAFTADSGGGIVRLKVTQDFGGTAVVTFPSAAIFYVYTGEQGGYSITCVFPVTVEGPFRVQLQGKNIVNDATSYIANVLSFRVHTVKGA